MKKPTLKQVKDATCKYCVGGREYICNKNVKCTKIKDLEKCFGVEFE